MQLYSKISGFDINELLAAVQFQEELHDVVCILNSNSYSSDVFQKYNLLIAIGSHKSLLVEEEIDTLAFQKLYDFQTENKDWLFGFLSYDLKNSIEHLQSTHEDNILFPLLFFFIPKLLLKMNTNGEIELHISDSSYIDLANQLMEKICLRLKFETQTKNTKIEIETKLSKEYYLESVEKIKKHIKYGDVYELNFCQEFFSNKAEIMPFQTYLSLNSHSEMPFSSFFKLDDKFLMCASPERYLQKTGNKIISQPIKGTSRRFENFQDDESSKAELRNNQKEVSENVMIVDLVRNDLSRSAILKSVKVEEFCKVYSFPKVHQMISTISSELAPEFSWTDVLKTTFPMGSMTGAPKVKAMELIEKYEKTKRGLYSGSVGYVTPDGDFDFNVVIRSIQYNQSKKSLSFITGSAITILSEAEKEYEECLLKAQAIFEVLG